MLSTRYPSTRWALSHASRALLLGAVFGGASVFSQSEVIDLTGSAELSPATYSEHTVTQGMVMEYRCQDPSLGERAQDLAFDCLKITVLELEEIDSDLEGCDKQVVYDLEFRHSPHENWVILGELKAPLHHTLSAELGDELAMPSVLFDAWTVPTSVYPSSGATTVYIRSQHHERAAVFPYRVSSYQSSALNTGESKRYLVQLVDIRMDE